MVHSGSVSPMTTTPSASPHLSVPATAPPLMLSSGGTAVQDLTHISTEILPTDLTSNSVFTQPSAVTPSDSKATVITHTKTLSTTTVSRSSPATDPKGGRTSGRKRTPKACKCCGPNSTGHNVNISASGRGSGRARGAGRNIGNTLKRNFQVNPIKSVDLTNDKTADGDDASGSIHQPVAASGSPSQLPGSLVSLQNEKLKNCVTFKNEEIKKKKKSILGSKVHVSVEKEGSHCPSTEMTLVGKLDQGLCVLGNQTEVRENEIKGVDGDIVSSNTDALGPGINHNPQNLQHKDRGQSNTVHCSFSNRETVNLSDTEEGVQEDCMIVIEPGNGPLSTSWPITPGTLHDLHPETEVSHSPEKIDLFSLKTALSNGRITPSKYHNHSPSTLELETSFASEVSPPTFSPITVSRKEYPWAVWDHMLYPLSGTWDNIEEKTLSKNSHQDAVMDDVTQRDEILEQRIHMVHEFLEQFYIKYGSFIPLSETDVLEHLKTEGKPHLIDSGLDIKGAINRYRAGLASVPVACFMVTYNKHTLSLEDLSTLEEQNWLNDQIINMYGELIMEATEHKVHFFNSFFHKQLVAKGYDGVKRWTKKVDLFSKWLLLIPIHLEIHWSLVTVTMATKTISYYDSQGIVFRHTTDNIMKYLQSEASEKKLTAFQKGWTTTIIKGIPQQKNDSDCGVFILEYCRRLSVKKPLLFSQEDMPCIRKRIYKELCDCHLNN